MNKYILVSNKITERYIYIYKMKEIISKTDF